MSRGAKKSLRVSSHIILSMWRTLVLDLEMLDGSPATRTVPPQRLPVGELRPFLQTMSWVCGDYLAHLSSTRRFWGQSPNCPQETLPTPTVLTPLPNVHGGREGREGGSWPWLGSVGPVNQKGNKIP